MKEEKDAEIARLIAQLAQRSSLNSQESKDIRQTSTSPILPTTLISRSDLKLLIIEAIREYQASLNLPILGYHKPYPTHYDQIPFPHHCTKTKFWEVW